MIQYKKNIINSLLDNKIIEETTGYSRNQIFTFQKYTDLFLLFILYVKKTEKFDPRKFIGQKNQKF